MRVKLMFLVIAGVAVVLAAGSVLAACGAAATTTTTTTSAATSSTTGPGGAAPIRVVVPLSGSEVMPPVQTAAGGTFTLLVEASPSGSFNVSFTLEVTDLSDAVAAHIHLGAKGTEGEVVMPLFTGPTKTGTFTGILAEGTISEKDLAGPMQGKTFQDLIGVVLAGQTYVNVHTTKYPNGEIRGQIIIAGGEAGTTTSVVGGGSTTTSSGGGGY
jgi:hypothetical protein